MWNTGFNKETHNFSINNYLYKSKSKIKYEELENFLIKELNIIIRLKKSGILCSELALRFPICFYLNHSI